MRYFKKAQATVEALFITALVAMSIVLVGSYVKGTFFARVKAYEDEFAISESDPLKQAPKNDYRIPNCDCSDWQSQRCGGTTGGRDPDCPYGYRKLTRSCIGEACAFIRPPPLTSQCVVDPTCCDDWVFICDPTQGDYSCCGRLSNIFTTVEPGVDPNDMYCFDGYGEQNRTCGTTTVERKCERYAGNPNGCDFWCVRAGTSNRNWPQGTQVCPRDDLRLLASRTNYTLAYSGGQSTQAQCSTPLGSLPKCEVYCRPGFFPDPANNQCLACQRIDLLNPPYAMFGWWWRYVASNSVNGGQQNFDIRRADFDPGSLPPSVAFHRNNINRIEVRIMTINNGGNNDPIGPGGSGLAFNAALNGTSSSPYQIAYVQRPAPQVCHVTVNIPEPISRYLNQANCPSYLNGLRSTYNFCQGGNHKHDESCVAYVIWDANNLVDRVRIECCSPDGSGNVGFVNATYRASIFLNGC